MPPRDDEVQTLLEQLSAELERSVLVDDASLRLLAYSPTLGSDDEVRKTAILTRETPRGSRDLHFRQGSAAARRGVSPAISTAPGASRAPRSPSGRPRGRTSGSTRGCACRSAARARSSA